MVNPIVSEMHSVSTVDSESAEVKIRIDVKQISYKFVRTVEDEIYKFVENLKKIGSVPEKAENIPASVPYNEEELQVIQGSTRENVWGDYQRAFPGSKRTKRGVETQFKNWKRFQQSGPEKKESPKKPVTMVPIADLSGWQRKFILKHRSDENLKKKFNEKWPGVNITSEMVARVLEEGPPVKKVKKTSDTTGAVSVPENKKQEKKEGNSVTRTRRHKLEPNDKVVQIAGLAPAVGVGVVQSVRKDDVVTVKFSGSTKVLHMDNFALAKAKGGGANAENNH